jgi:cobalamin biosynthesis protein CobT
MRRNLGLMARQGLLKKNTDAEELAGAMTEKLAELFSDPAQGRTAGMPPRRRMH